MLNDLHTVKLYFDRSGNHSVFLGASHYCRSLRTSAYSDYINSKEMAEFGIE